MMIIIKLITILFILAAVLSQQPTKRELAQDLEQAQLTNTFSFNQTAPILSEETQDSIEEKSSLFMRVSSALPWIFQQFLLALPWIYLTYSLAFIMIVSRGYQKEQICFTYTIVSLIKFIHNGAIYMFFCQVIEGRQIKGEIFFAAVVIVSLWVIACTIFSQHLKWKQIAILSAYLSFLAAVFLCEKEFFDISSQLIYTFSHFLQIHHLPPNKQVNDDIMHTLLVNYFINTLIFSFSVTYPQILISQITQGQYMFFLYSTPIFGFGLLFFKSPFLRKRMGKAIVVLYRKSKLRVLGEKLQTDTCAICWQQMQIYLGVSDINDFDYEFGSSLVRVHRNHIFHQKCIFRWTLFRSTCPLDNEPIDL